MPSDLEKFYLGSRLTATYPDAPQESKDAAAKLDAKEAKKAEKPAETSAAVHAADALAGALKGAVAQAIGLPGDIESLVRMLSGGDQVLPTTEDFEGMMPPVVPNGVDMVEQAQREPGAKAAETVGEVLPFAPLALIKHALTVMGKRAGKVGAGAAAAGASTESAAPHDNAMRRNVDGGKRPNQDATKKTPSSGVRG
jgi:hypothetical protein